MNKKRAGKKRFGRVLAVMLAVVMAAVSFGAGAKETKAAGYTVTLHENLQDPAKTATITGEGYLYADADHAEFGGSMVYYTFGGSNYELVSWNTQADGLGTEYSPNGAEIRSDLDLYAQWRSVSTITIHSNIPGNDETNSARWEVGKPVYFLRATSICLNYNEPYSDGELYYEGYNGQRLGYVVCGWNTKADGTGTPYNFGDTFPMPANDIELYLQWEEGNVVTTHTNTGTPGDFTDSWTVPKNGRITFNVYNDGEQYTEIYNASGVRLSAGSRRQGSIDMSGYTFDGFNTMANGSGTSYPRSSEIYPSGDMDLYMQWLIPFTVTLHDNTSANRTEVVSGIGTLNAYDSYASFSDGDSVYYSTPFTNPGYERSGWNTEADGTGTHYDKWSSIPVAADMDLYAEWAKAYTVTLYENTPASNLPVTVMGTGWLNLYSDSVTFGNDSASFSFSYPGYILTSWNTKADGSGTEYSMGGRSLNQDLELYAQWSKSVTVTFHDNTSAGKQEVIECSSRLSADAWSANFDNNYKELSFENTGFALTSWNTKADGSGTAYPVSAEFDVTADVDLYAQWSSLHTVTFTGDWDGSGSSSSFELKIPDGGYLHIGNSATSLELSAYNPDGTSYYSSNYAEISRKDAAFSHLEDTAGTQYASGAFSAQKAYGPVTADMTLTAVFTTDTVTITYITDDPLGTFYETGTNTVTRKIARGGIVEFVYSSSDAWQIGYSEDLSTETYYDRLQFNNGAVTADKDMTLYAVYSPSDNVSAFMDANDPNPFDADSHFYYAVLNNNTVVITDYDGSGENARIPSVINGKTVSNYVMTFAFSSGTGNHVKSLVYPDYIPHKHYLDTDSFGEFGREMFPELESITFEGPVPEVKANTFKGLEITGYYPSTWTSVPSSTFGGAKNITWVPYDVTVSRNIAVYSTDVNCTGSVANVVINSTAPYHDTDTVTVTAETKPGYSFAGWYEVTGTAGGNVSSFGTTCLCPTLNYTFAVMGDTAITAVYEPVPAVNADVTVSTANGATFIIDGTTYTTDHTVTLPVGSSLTITAGSAKDVLQWENGSSKVLGKSGSLTVTVVGDMDICLVYKAETAGQSFVQFMNSYGQVLLAETWKSTDTVTFPDVPSKFGCTFEKWVFAGTDEEATADAIRAKIAANTANITVKPVYAQDSRTFTVTVAYKTENGQVLKTGTRDTGVVIGTGYTVTAPIVSGYVFNCWKNSDGTILGYSKEYYIQVTGDTTLIACYGPNAAEAKPVIVLGELSRTSVDSLHRVTGYATRSIPEGYSLLEHGILYAENFNSPDKDTFVIDAAGIQKYISNSTSLNGVVRINYQVNSDSDQITVRGYMILEDNNTGIIETYYTDEVKTGSYSAL